MNWNVTRTIWGHATGKCGSQEPIRRHRSLSASYHPGPRQGIRHTPVPERHRWASSPEGILHSSREPGWEQMLPPKMNPLPQKWETHQMAKASQDGIDNQEAKEAAHLGLCKAQPSLAEWGWRRTLELMSPRTFRQEWQRRFVSTGRRLRKHARQWNIKMGVLSASR